MYVAYTDASVNNDYGGIGYVILKGNTILDRCRKRVSVKSSVTLEKEALKELLIHINLLGIKNIEIRTDLSTLPYYIKRCRNPLVSNKNKNKARRHISEIANLISDLDQSVNIEWVPRNQNKIAHKLSREAASGIHDDLKESLIKKEIELKSQQEELERRKQLVNETKMVIQYRSNILFRCATCNESKPATEYPRYKEGNKRRTCNSCKSKLNQIHIY